MYHEAKFKLVLPDVINQPPPVFYTLKGFFGARTFTMRELKLALTLLDKSPREAEWLLDCGFLKRVN